MSDSGSDNDARHQRLIDAAMAQAAAPRATGHADSATSPYASGGRAARRVSPFAPPELPNYEFLGEIHRGGQGVVYRALQRSTGRDVAIKVIRFGAQSSQFERARFEREVRVLGRLRHQNIVSIFDSGAVEGHAYFVMDLIDGRPLDQHFGHRPPVRAVLECFHDICDAVNAAHLLGVIHRDLKPANVRVDKEGRPHVLDFGLARPADPEATAMTETGQFVGSLPWASPEQANGEGDALDLRTDVYSLGVMLHQVLTGEFPYSVFGSPRAVLDAIVNAPPTPLRAVRPDAPEDVETIVLKCLQKDPARRYQSAGELGRDVACFLRGEPIEARRDSVIYRLRTGLRRHRAAVGVGLAMIVLLSGGLSFSLYHWRQAELARREAARQALRTTEQARRAETESVKAQELTDFLTGLLVSGDPMQTRFKELTVVDLLREAVRRLDQGALHGPPEVDARVAISKAMQGYGLIEEALVQAQTAADRAYRDVGLESPNYARGLTQLAFCLRESRRLDRALPVAEHALELARRMRDDSILIPALVAMGKTLASRDQFESAELHLREAWELALRSPEALDEQRIAIAADVAALREKAGDPADAEALMRAAFEKYVEIYGPRHMTALRCRSNLAGMLKRQGRTREAIVMYREALETMRELLGEHPDVAVLLGNLGAAVSEVEGPAAAEPYLEQALEMRRSLAPPDDPSLAFPLNNLATIRAAQGRYDEAAELLAEAGERMEHAYGADHSNVAVLRENQAALLYRAERFDQAVPILRELLARCSQSFSEDHPRVLSVLGHLGLCLWRTGNLDESEGLLREALRRSRQSLGDQATSVGVAQFNLSGLLHERGRLDEAEELARSAVAILRDGLNADHPQLASALHHLGELLLTIGSPGEALECFEEARSIAARTLGEEHPDTWMYEAAAGEALCRVGREEEGRARLCDAAERLTVRLGQRLPATRAARRCAQRS